MNMAVLPIGASIATTCPYCGVGCGVRVGQDKLTISGDVQHPANAGRLCVKGSALAETLGTEARLLHPQRRDADSGPQLWQRARWADALSQVATRFAQTIAAHGPDSVAFYVSGQLTTEGNSVAHTLKKVYICSRPI